MTAERAAAGFEPDEASWTLELPDEEATAALAEELAATMLPSASAHLPRRRFWRRSRSCRPGAQSAVITVPSARW
jgi:hypothetical protein